MGSRHLRVSLATGGIRRRSRRPEGAPGDQGAPSYIVSWTVLASLLAVILVGACFYDRTGWPGRLAGESTYLMQALSLGEDFDLEYTRADFDRLLLADLGNPTDLALVSGTGGRRITFDRPFPYALYLAPFLKLWPRQGFAIANALLLTFVSVFAARTLERRLGAWSPLWVALLVFGSVLFAYVFLATGDLFLFAVTLVAFCLVARGAATSDEAGSSSRRWLAVGALLAVPAATEPLYVVLCLAAFFAPSEKERGTSRAALAIGFLVSLVVIAVVGWWAGGGLIGASGFRFTPETGFPLVDFTAAEWRQAVRRLDALYWDGAPRFSWGVDPLLWTWDGIYLLAGRSIGLLPYFAPVLLLATGSFSGYRRPIAFSAAAWAAGIVILHPFNIYGGEGALANRLFLPIYGALWMLAAPPRKRTLFAAAVVALASPLLWPLWTSPWSYPILDERGYRHAGPVARRILPYETSQRWLPGGPVEEHNGLMVKFLSDRAWAESQRGRLVIDGKGPVEFLVVSGEDLDALRFDFGKDAPAEIVFEGGKVAERILQPNGGISFRVLPRGWPRRHPMWWTPERQWLYLLTLELPETPDKALGFELYGERFDES